MIKCTHRNSDTGCPDVITTNDTPIVPMTKI